MSRSARFLINAAVCLLVGAHAIWWFATGRADLAPDLQVGLRAAQAVIGLAGAVWFFVRARSAST